MYIVPSLYLLAVSKKKKLLSAVFSQWRVAGEQRQLLIGSNSLSVCGLPGCVLAVWLLFFHKQWKHPEFNRFLLNLILASLRFTVKVIVNGRLVLFSCKSYPKSPVVLQSKRMNIWCLEHAWKVRVERTSMRLWLCVQAGFEWCITSAQHFLTPVLANVMYTALFRHLNLCCVKRKAVACHLIYFLLVWKVGILFARVCMHSMDHAGFIFLCSTVWTSPMSTAGTEPSLKPAGMPWTRWPKFELMSILCCQKYKFSLSCTITADLFGLYLISASFPGILNNQNKSWYILFEQVWHSLSYRELAIYICLIFTVILYCRDIFWNYF